MNKDEIEAIAQRPTCCKSWGETVSLTKAERDALVAMARDGLRYRWLRIGDNDELVMHGADVENTWLLRMERLDKAIDAAMAKEEA